MSHLALGQVLLVSTVPRWQMDDSSVAHILGYDLLKRV